ncbi:hypothetical protein GE061_015822 [Apolygus lucorum]|uniref:Uncharacterized protein n=1 Tax=Apolygus lucorum TaxID=248454 RepID=A0A8S9XPW9_APOLU|nr:hypothetical protein GE061_015822 [Apolygus lucorum]
MMASNEKNPAQPNGEAVAPVVSAPVESNRGKSYAARGRGRGMSPYQRPRTSKQSTNTSFQPKSSASKMYSQRQPTFKASEAALHSDFITLREHASKVNVCLPMGVTPPIRPTFELFCLNEGVSLLTRVYWKFISTRDMKGTQNLDFHLLDDDGISLFPFLVDDGTGDSTGMPEEILADSDAAGSNLALCIYFLGPAFSNKARLPGQMTRRTKAVAAVLGVNQVGPILVESDWIEAYSYQVGKLRKILQDYSTTVTSAARQKAEEVGDSSCVKTKIHILLGLYDKTVANFLVPVGETPGTLAVGGQGAAMALLPRRPRGHNGAMPREDCHRTDPPRTGSIPPYPKVHHTDVNPPATPYKLSHPGVSGYSSG